MGRVLHDHCTYLGADLDVSEIKKRHTDLRLSDTDDLPEGCYFDIVLILDVIEHIPEEELEGFLGRYCSMGNKLIINVPEIVEKEQLIDNNVNIPILILDIKRQGFKLINFENWHISVTESYNFLVFERD